MTSFDLAPVENVLLSLGYKRVRKFIYKATWSSPEVEHFLYLDKFHRRRTTYAALYGIRNPAADLFSIQCLQKYGSEVFRMMWRYDAKVKCMMNFDFWIFSGETDPWMIDFDDSIAAAETLRRTMEEHLMPLIGTTTTLQALRDFLLRDTRKAGWTYVNGALRAAHIVSVSRQIGITRDDIINSLKPHLRWIELGLGQGARLSAVEFLEQVIIDWDVQANSLPTELQ